MATLSTDAPISPLRQRMQAHAGLGTAYAAELRQVRRFAAFLGRSPDTATAEDIRRFHLYQHENGVGPATINGAVSALRLLFLVTLKRRDLARVNYGDSALIGMPIRAFGARTPQSTAQ